MILDELGEIHSSLADAIPAAAFTRESLAFASTTSFAHTSTKGLVVRNIDGSAKTDDQADKAMG